LIHLDGRLEKSGFPPILTAFLTLTLAFILFQGISLVVSLALIFSRGVSPADLSDVATLLEQQAGPIIVANTVGQVFGLLLPALLISRLHTSDWRAFLRLRGADARFVGLAVAGLIVLIPVVQWLGVVSDALPWPDFIRDFEQAQMDLIERVLMQDFRLAFTVSMLALTPAICEEILFRGYVQRQAERSAGAMWGVVISGVVFGLYHLRLTQALPLSVLGVFMAYVTWRSGSLLPAMIVHLANNSFAAVLGKLANQGVIEAETAETLQIPLYILLPSAAVLTGIIILMQRFPVRTDRFVSASSAASGPTDEGHEI
jgi:membrane protease YdiL (CAAX protease family)